MTKRQPRHEESALQKAMIEYLDRRGVRRDNVVFAVPNEGRRSRHVGGILKSMGLLPGVADLVIVAPGGRAHFVEVKTPKGRLSKAQREFRDRCVAMRVPWAIVRSLDDMERVIEGWHLVARRSLITSPREAKAMEIDARTWCPVIDIETGTVRDLADVKTGIARALPDGLSLSVRYKASVGDRYFLLDEHGRRRWTWKGFHAPDNLVRPEEKGEGDHVMIRVDESGIVAGWDPRISEDEWKIE
jgi:hypothetical protein